MEVTEINCYGKNEVVLIYCNIFIENKARFLGGVICVLFNKVRTGRDISVDLRTLNRDIKVFEKRIGDRLENGNADDENIITNTMTFYRAIASEFRERYNLLEKINLNQLCG